MVTENADFWSKIGIFGVRNFLRELIIEEVHNQDKTVSKLMSLPVTLHCWFTEYWKTS